VDRLYYAVPIQTLVEAGFFGTILMGHEAHPNIHTRSTGFFLGGEAAKAWC